eukprot:14303715-Alexandrium_andersonii.AAC.1
MRPSIAQPTVGCLAVCRFPPPSAHAFCATPTRLRPPTEGSGRLYAAWIALTGEDASSVPVWGGPTPRTRGLQGRQQH